MNLPSWYKKTAYHIVTRFRLCKFYIISENFLKDWKDIYSFNIGARYQVTNSIGLLAGYIYENGPIPDETFDPSVPDNGSSMYCIGADYRYKNFKFGIAYDYQKVRTRNKNNAIDDNHFDGIVNPATSANGRYRTELHIVSAGITYVF